MKHKQKLSKNEQWLAQHGLLCSNCGSLITSHSGQTCSQGRRDTPPGSRFQPYPFARIETTA